MRILLRGLALAAIVGTGSGGVAQTKSGPFIPTPARKPAAPPGPAAPATRPHDAPPAATSGMARRSWTVEAVLGPGFGFAGGAVAFKFSARATRELFRREGASLVVDLLLPLTLSSSGSTLPVLNLATSALSLAVTPSVRLLLPIAAGGGVEFRTASRSTAGG